MSVSAKSLVVSWTVPYLTGPITEFKVMLVDTGLGSNSSQRWDDVALLVGDLMQVFMERRCRERCGQEHDSDAG